jgi:hypothetical protein
MPRSFETLDLSNKRFPNFRFIVYGIKMQRATQILEQQLAPSRKLISECLAFLIYPI